LKNTLTEHGLPLIQDADLNGKIVLVRFDHNVVKQGEIRDPFRWSGGEACHDDPCGKTQGQEDREHPLQT